MHEKTPNGRRIGVNGAGQEESTSASKARHRVLRDAIRSYEELTAEQSREHRLWQERFSSEVTARHQADAKSSRQVDDLSKTLLTITNTLAEVHGTPDLGNKSDPVDELVYIILSRRTREDAYQAAYRALKLTFRSWEQLPASSIEQIARIIGFSGLGRRKAQSLRLALGELIERFGVCTLEPTASWDDQTVFEFLCGLPEIGPKSAACVMMCSLDRPAFPVDAHVGRVVERLRVFDVAAIDLAGKDHKVKQRMLQDAVPPSLRYPLHVNALVHGRKVCLPHSPRCGQCVISRYCAFARLSAPDRTGSSRDRQ